MDKLLVYKISQQAQIPTVAYLGDAGLDLFSAEDIELAPLERCMVKTGIKIALPVGAEGQIRSRSGLALENGITVLNSPGTIDAGYRGEVAVILINLSEQSFHIRAGMRIAQLVVCPILRPEIEEVDELPVGSRGAAGFGSSGT
jgi:dUTP pyrophosphatase